MIVFNHKADLIEKLSELKNQQKTIGFVPTMGALHEGHLSLIDCSLNETDITVASIFVNPTQFNDKNDLKKYPRNIQSDLEKLKKAGCDIAYVPDVEDIYPNDDKRVFEFGGIDKLMEGKFRPGHFNGVGQVVSILFDIVNPDKAFFGQKDFQQVAIVKYLTEKIMKRIDIEVVSCPIVREQNGLAMSSRNELLSSEQRDIAANIYRVLKEAKQQKEHKTVEAVKQWVVEQINLYKPIMKTEYFEIVDDQTLEAVSEWNSANEIFGCIAVFCGNIRLIDNIRFH